MGCFNLTGGFSGLPMYCGDRIVAFICSYNKKTTIDSLADIISSWSFMLSPVCPPLRGEYDDYGSICGIDRDAVCSMLEEVTGRGIDEIIRAVPEEPGTLLEKWNMVVSDKEKTMYGTFDVPLPDRGLLLVLDREDAYDALVGTDGGFYDFDRSYGISHGHRMRLNEKPVDRYMETFVNNYATLYSYGNSAGNTTNVDPCIDDGMFRRSSEHMPKNMMHLLVRFPQYTWKPEMKKPFVDFLKFWWRMYDTEMEFGPSRYARQFRQDRMRRGFMESCLEIMKRIETNDDEEATEDA